MPKTPAASGRCPWCGENPLYLRYHDEEWGVPEHDGRALWEKLILDGFQAGLAWITILKKREAFREAFEGFAPEHIARYDPAEVERLLADARIVRHRGKIEATINNAQAYLQLGGAEAFSNLCWQAVGGSPRQNAFTTLAQVPAQTPESQALSKTLKKAGFKFCGPTIVYAWMQACGLVNDHLTTCPRWRTLGGH